MAEPGSPSTPPQQDASPCLGTGLLEGALPEQAGAWQQPEQTRPLTLTIHHP